MRQLSKRVILLLNQGSKINILLLHPVQHGFIIQVVIIIVLVLPPVILAYAWIFIDDILHRYLFVHVVVFITQVNFIAIFIHVVELVVAVVSVLVFISIHMVVQCFHAKLFNRHWYGFLGVLNVMFILNVVIKLVLIWMCFNFEIIEEFVVILAFWRWFYLCIEIIAPFILLTHVFVATVVLRKYDFTPLVADIKFVCFVWIFLERLNSLIVYYSALGIKWSWVTFLK